ncbi:type VI secretion system tube protein Hcp [Pelagicoccus sp. SDUM812002]|uniref:type VI secretion system tube protein Hcp n=1 Tax=Pelagicoccus sp. SDUM812002 TaxID=3041266 RepID=UPI00280DBAD4|nr:type VI secretion system tube protein Hcp [Pelagicoccus sp. SDUM812002]MDQ8186872.1 type VI secretion system tube protein Hcp [Pelagicoccus sp. SDUM812002]
MKRRSTYLAILLTHLLVCTAFGAAYMKVDGIKGESKSADQKDWIDIVSVSGLVSPRDAASGLATGKRQHKPITIVKQVDKSSPLFQASSGNVQNPLHEAKNKKSDNPLHGVNVLSTIRDGNTETITLGYTSIDILTNTATPKPLKAKTVKATNYNSSRSNKNSNYNRNIQRAALPYPC